MIMSAERFKHGIVRYTYRTGTDDMTRRYGIKTHWHGAYECDIEDFRKFYYDAVIRTNGNGEVTRIYLTQASGVWLWDAGKGWQKISV